MTLEGTLTEKTTVEIPNNQRRIDILVFDGTSEWFVQIRQRRLKDLIASKSIGDGVKVEIFCDLSRSVSRAKNRDFFYHNNLVAKEIN